MTVKADRTLFSQINASYEVGDLANLGVTVTAVGQESIDALEVIKSTDQLTSSQLKVELDAVRRHLETKEFDNEQMRTQLMETLISKDKLRKQLDDVAAVPAEDAQKQKKEDSEKTAKLKAALKQTVQVSGTRDFCESSPYPLAQPQRPRPAFTKSGRLEPGGQQLNLVRHASPPPEVSHPRQGRRLRGFNWIPALLHGR